MSHLFPWYGSYGVDCVPSSSCINPFSVLDIKPKPFGPINNPVIR